MQDFRVHFREEEVIERLRGAERVPKTTVGVEHTLMHFAIVGAEIDLLPLPVHFVKFVRK